MDNFGVFIPLHTSERIASSELSRHILGHGSAFRNEAHFNTAEFSIIREIEQDEPRVLLARDMSYIYHHELQSSLLQQDWTSQKADINVIEDVQLASAR